MTRTHRKEVRLKELRLTQKIKKLNEQHGGWPGAFQTGSSKAVADAEEPMLDRGG